PALHLADDQEPPEEEEDPDPERVHDEGVDPVALLLAGELLHPGLLEVGDEVRVLHGDRAEVLELAVLGLDAAADDVLADAHLRDLALGELVLELGIGDLVLRRPRLAEALDEEKNPGENQEPEDEVAAVVAHEALPPYRKIGSFPNARPGRKFPRG